MNYDDPPAMQWSGEDRGGGGEGGKGERGGKEGGVGDGYGGGYAYSQARLL